MLPRNTSAQTNLVSFLGWTKRFVGGRGCCFDRAPDSLYCHLLTLELSSLVESGKLGRTRADTLSRMEETLGKLTTCLRWEEKGEAGHGTVPSARTLLRRSSQGWLFIIQGSPLQGGTPDHQTEVAPLLPLTGHSVNLIFLQSTSPSLKLSYFSNYLFVVSFH